MMTSNEIRQRFLRFFEERDHNIVPSSSLVPADDPTLLFTNAGMVQFKDVFLGRTKARHPRVADVQRCLRAGGKHNDLENVGYTARHHTFFEMLGNWSFGDYFKREAIRYAWQLLTVTFELPAEKLWITVYHTDDEAYSLWKEDIGVPAERIVRIGDEGGAPYTSDNFWQMADTGPCGPCSEIFFDHGPEVEGGPPGSATEDGDRYIEIWNLVFMQFDRAADGTLSPLPAPCVDTGMGLERIAAVMQGVKNNYDIDLFRDLIKAAAAATETDDLASNSLKVIADHIRATAFLIVDGVLPANEGRGYVLRRIMRRAIRHGYKLGQQAPFFYKLVAALDTEMGAAYPELRRQRREVAQIILQEEERFAQTLEQGLGLLEKAIAALQGNVIPGDTVFKLYDTYGFPVDLTADIARERDLSLDMAGFERAMAAQRERARAASRFDTNYSQDIVLEDETVFSGYEHLRDAGRVTALFRDGQAVDRLAAGERGIIVLDHTPFYAESGGQVGDTGMLSSDTARFQVEDTQKRGAAHAHIGETKTGGLALGERLHCEVDVEHRLNTVLNHSATHLLHAALREVLGEHVRQKGSLVAPDRLRFDFSHARPVTPAELDRIEALVNSEIRRNDAAHVRTMSYDEAIEAGAMAFFGEKYGDTVRVMQFGEFSTELCGGTHVRRTGDIGVFKIVSESGVAAGIRRIEAFTGERALTMIKELESTLHQVGDLVKTDRDNVVARVEHILARERTLEKEVQQLRSRLASGQGSDLSTQAVDVDGVKVLAARLDGADAKALREAVDQLKNKLQSAAVVLGAVDGGKVRLVAGVTKDKTDAMPAGELANTVAAYVGGRGGGRADMAQAGGSDPTQLDAALQSVAPWVRQRLSRDSARSRSS